jgi:RNA polymerase primary sigma factor
MRQFKVTERKTDRTDVLERYFSDISGIPILDPDQENEIAVRARSGDEEAKSILVKSNLRFVVSVAKSYSGTKYPLMDLISQGNIGLIESAETFDPSTGFKFISYAIWRIRSNILKYIQSQSRTIKVPQSVQNTMREVRKIHDHFNQTQERDATIPEIIEKLSEMSDKKWISHNMEHIAAGMAADSFNIPLELRNGESEDDVKAPITWLESEDYATDSLEKNEGKELADLLLDALSLREKKVVMDRIGENWGIQKSFEEIGAQFGKSSYWANKTYKTAIRKLKIRASDLKKCQRI